jgi:hypothetical protein
MNFRFQPAVSTGRCNTYPLIRGRIGVADEEIPKKASPERRLF